MVDVAGAAQQASEAFKTVSDGATDLARQAGELTKGFNWFSRNSMWGAGIGAAAGYFMGGATGSLTFSIAGYALGHALDWFQGNNQPAAAPSAPAP